MRWERLTALLSARSCLSSARSAAGSATPTTLASSSLDMSASKAAAGSVSRMKRSRASPWAAVPPVVELVSGSRAGYAVSPVVLVEPVVEIVAASGALYEAADTSKSLPDKGIGYQDEGQLSAVRLAEGC
jgi:hypothetical protein